MNSTKLTQVKESIELDILNRVLRPNQRLIESELAIKFGLSRTPLREALRQLEIKGYLTRLPSRGYVVAYHTATDIRDIFEVREALETLAIRLACDKITQSQIDKAAKYNANYIQAIEDSYLKGVDWNNLFHSELYDASGNKQLVANIQNLRDIVRLAHVSRNLSHDDMVAVGKEHNDILQAVSHHDKRKAVKAVQTHLRNICVLYTKFL